MNFKSRFNIFYRDYVYNLVSHNYVKVNKTLLDYLKQKERVIEENIPKDIIETLKRNNIITEFDEIQYLDYRYNVLKFDQRKASYIVYPTLRCNFNCNYCFETVKTGTLGQEEISKLKLFFERKMHELDEINVRWSGGEPLLVWDKIKQICELLKKFNGSYSTSIATNGYLLNEKIVKEMLEYGFSSLQITIDGNKEMHNSIRYTSVDHNTYDRILDQISKSSFYLNIVIRYNIDQQNKDSFESLLKDLAKYELNKENIVIFVKPIRSKQGCLRQNNQIEEKLFFGLEKGYIKLAKQYGFKYAIHPNYHKHLRCIYHQINSFAIDPALNLYKCAENIGLEKFQVGKINNNGSIKINNPDLIQRSSMYSPISITECRDCKVLPICNGKCPIEWEKNYKEKDAGCIPEKRTIKYKIEQLIQNGS